MDTIMIKPNNHFAIMNDDTFSDVYTLSDNFLGEGNTKLNNFLQVLMALYINVGRKRTLHKLEQSKKFKRK
jgi:hypothetical protein